MPAAHSSKPTEKTVDVDRRALRRRRLVRGDPRQTGAPASPCEDKRGATRPGSRLPPGPPVEKRRRQRCAPEGTSRAKYRLGHRHGKRVGGKNPCHGTQVPAGPLEDRVFDALASLPDVEAKNSDTLRSRKLLLRFSAAWSLLSPESRRQALPRVIREVAWDADTCQVSVVLDEAALERYAGETGKKGSEKDHAGRQLRLSNHW